MLVELIQTTTRDGVRLDGVLQESSRDIEGAFPDAACLVHGTGGNFYSSSLFHHLAERLVSEGCSVLRVNTRGHDLMSTAATPKGAVRQGAAHEFVDDCRADIAAWLTWLKERNFRRIALIGHSLGAVKSLYALAHEPELPVRQVIALSPPRLSYSWFCQTVNKQVFLDTYQEAQALIEDNRAGALMEVTFPLPFAITAAGFAEKYGPDERYNFLKHIGSIATSILITFGSIEVANNVAFMDAPQAIKNLPHQPKSVNVEVIPNADHFYSEARDELADRVLNWLT